MSNTAPRPFLSLRARLMWALSLSFLLIFVLIFFGLLRALEDMQLSAARGQLAHVLGQVAAQVNGEEVASLYLPSGDLKPNYWQDPVYQKNFGGLSSVAATDPRAFPYAYLRKNPYADLRERGSFELVASAAGRQGQMRAESKVLAGGLENTALSEAVQKQDGYYLSGAVPVRDARGRVICAMGVDFRIDSLYLPFLTVRERSWQVMLGLYLGLLALFLFISSRYARPVAVLSSEMQRMKAGDYQRDFSNLRQGRFRDEVSTLSEVFEDLLAKVGTREKALVQQLTELKIEVDQAKKKSQVAEIVESEGFLELREKARQMRERRAREA